MQEHAQTNPLARGVGGGVGGRHGTIIILVEGETFFNKH
jgi:hypothetical protein